MTAVKDALVVRVGMDCVHMRIANRADVRACLLAGEVDLVIAGRPPAVDGLVAEPFLPNPLVTVASPRHGLADKPSVPLAHLANEMFLLREVGSGTRAAVEDLFEVAGLPLKIGMVLGHIEAIKQAVAAGLGVSVLSEVAVKREILTHRLVILQVEYFPIQRRWYIARLAERPLNAHTAEFIEFLREYRLFTLKNEEVWWVFISRSCRRIRASQRFFASLT